MALLVFVRSMEVASRILAINILHVSIRTQHISLGGPATFAALLLVSRVLLPEAEAVDLMAAIIGHPGQILEPTSVLPLRNSLCLHGGLVLAALMAQVWVQRGSQTVFEAAKARDSRGACMPFFHPLSRSSHVGLWSCGLERASWASWASYCWKGRRWSIRCSSVCTRRGGKMVAWPMDLDVLFFRKAPQCTFWVTSQFVRLVLCW